MNIGKIGNKEKAIIHLAKQQLAMTEKEYRAALGKLGVASSKDLTYPQYEKLLQKFQGDGFVITGKKKGQYNRTPNATWDKEPMLKKIGALLRVMNLNWHYADGIARRMFKVDVASWCAPEQLHSIVAALEYKRRKIN